MEHTVQVELGEDIVAELRRRRPQQQRRMSSFEVHRRRLETRHLYGLVDAGFFSGLGLDDDDDDDTTTTTTTNNNNNNEGSDVGDGD